MKRRAGKPFVIGSSILASVPFGFMHGVFGNNISMLYKSPPLLYMALVASYTMVPILNKNSNQESLEAIKKFDDDISSEKVDFSDRFVNYDGEQVLFHNLSAEEKSLIRQRTARSVKYLSDIVEETPKLESELKACIGFTAAGYGVGYVLGKAFLQYSGFDIFLDDKQIN